MAIAKRILLTLGSEEIETALRDYIFREYPEYEKDYLHNAAGGRYVFL